MCLNLKQTQNLGTYLGVHLANTKRDNRLSSNILAKFNNIVQCRQSKYLNLAGRAILLITTLFSLPIHLMQIRLLPKHILNQMKLVGKKFLWNEQPDRNRMRLVSWNQITLPTKYGG